MTTPMTHRSLRFAAALASLCLWSASCSDDGGPDPMPDAPPAPPDARVPDAMLPPDAAAPDAAPPPECVAPEDCADGLFCNGAETCAGGQCAPAGTGACDDAIACTTDICDEGGERCRNTPNHDLCSNGLFCDGAEVCAAAGCAAGTPPATADGVPCRNGRITAGGAHTCALLNSGPVYCWGRSDLGQTGHGNTTVIGDNEPASAGGALASGGAVVVDVDAGDLHTCALLASGNVRCWGFGGSGRLGYGNQNNLGDGAGETPATLPNVDVGGTAIQIAAGGSHTCALLAGGAVRCWGLGSSGQLGYGNSQNVGDNEAPSAVGPVELGGAAVQITAGTSHTCALLDDGAVRCWGLGSLGRLGYGNTQSVGASQTPAAVGAVALGGPAAQIAAGGSHTCALLESGAVRCWGLGASGQLGYGSTQNVGDNETPTADVPLVSATVTELALGEAHTCARLENGGVRCWGRGGQGQLGNAATANIGDDEALPDVDIALGDPAVALAAGAEHTCALLDNGDVTCWGNAALGRLGHGDLVNIGDDEDPSAAGKVPLP
jgi:alpha-tubulin suppressor-like RCC1 family protein